MDFALGVRTSGGAELSFAVVDRRQSGPAMVGEEQVEIAVVIEVDEHKAAHPPIRGFAVAERLDATFGRDVGIGLGQGIRAGRGDQETQGDRCAFHRVPL